MSVRVRRANGERIIPDEKVAEYLEMGYSVLDAKGNVVKRPEPKTIPELKAALVEKDKLIAELSASVEELKAALVEKDKLIAELSASVEELKAALVEKDTVTSCNGPANTDEQDTPTISPSEDKNGATAPSEKKKTKPASKPE